MRVLARLRSSLGRATIILVVLGSVAVAAEQAAGDQRAEAAAARAEAAAARAEAAAERTQKAVERLERILNEVMRREEARRRR